MDIVRGSSVVISCTVYSYWSGTSATSVVADLTGAEVRLLVKLRPADDDAAALLNKAGGVINPAAGLMEVGIDAADTNDIPYSDMYYEIVTKLSDSTFIRNGVEYFNLKPNVLKTLF